MSLFALVLGAAMLLVAAPAASAGIIRITGRICVSKNVSVTLQGVGPETVAGMLCQPLGSSPKTVQLLIPGASYNKTYWDFPYKPGTYSYASAANAAGYATFAIDRLGTGNSSHPDGATSLTSASEADVVHQVVGALRAGRIGSTAYTRVALVGHSYGSIISWFEAGTYHDVDAVIDSGISHVIDPNGVATFSAALYPAMADPKFASTIRDPNYFTTLPGSRASLFLPANAEAGVISTDEQTKDTLTTSQLNDLGPALASPVSGQIDVPVLIAAGQNDVLFCSQGSDGTCDTAADYRAQEAPFYGSAPCLESYVEPGSGHDLNLSPNAPQFYAEANGWLDSVLGTRGSAPHC